MQRAEIRKARVTEAKAIKRLVDLFASEEEVLPRPLTDLYSRIREFWVVADQKDGVIGCVGLKIFWEDLAEVRTLAVDPNHQSFGYGRQLVLAAMHEAKQLGLSKVFALTNKPGFFKKLEYEEVEKDALPLKVWNDCIHCVKFYHCDEVALVFDCSKNIPEVSLARIE